MTLKQKARRAKRLRRDGLTIVQIAATLGVARSTASNWLCDPDGSKARARKERYRKPCADGCGRLVSGSDGRGPNAPQRCTTCALDRLHAQQRLMGECINECVVRLWKNGKTRGEIAKIMGWTAKSASVKIINLRSAGYDIPYRRTLEQRERMGCTPATMARARDFRPEAIAA